MKFTSSQEFNQYTKNLASHIKNTPLRPLRLAFAKVEGFSSVQSFCIELDKNSLTQELSFSTNAKVERLENKVLFKLTLTLNESIKYQGIEAWNDHIEESMNIDFALTEPLAKMTGNNLYICSGTIEKSELSDIEMDNIIDDFLQKHQNSNVHLVAQSLCEQAKNYLLSILESGETIYQNRGNNIPFYTLSDINMCIDDNLFKSAIPYATYSETEKDILFELKSDSGLSLSQMQSLAIKDIFEIALTKSVNEFSDTWLSSLEKESMNLREWEKSLDNYMGINPLHEIQNIAIETMTSKLIKGEIY
jgi:hypothetical protein